MATTRFLIQTFQDYLHPSSSFPSTTTTIPPPQAATVTSSHQLYHYFHAFPRISQNLHHPTALLRDWFAHHHLNARFLGAVLPALHRTAVKLARPPLDSLRAILPEPLQSLLPHLASTSASESGGLLHALLPAPLLDRLHDALGGPVSNGTLVGTLVAALLPLLVLLFRVMAAWRPYLTGGRYSPYSVSAPRGGASPQVTESDYHYIGPDDIVDPPGEARGNHTYGPTSPVDDASAPDVLILRHRGSSYPMHFPAYCIGEGILRVGELRRYAAEKTGTPDPRRIKLLYKGKQLKDDAVAAREEGLKQNSELMCIVSENPIAHGSSDDSDSASDSDFLKAGGSPRVGRAYSAAAGAGTGGHGMTAPRVDVDGTIIHDGPTRKKSKKRSSRRDHEGDDRHLNAPKPAGAATSRPTTPHNTTSTAYAPPPAATATASGTSTPKTPMDELGMIANEFRTKWMPLCDSFLASPPPDTKARHQEYTKLSESILAQIIFKLDGVTTEGDQDARKRRKAIIQETQAVLSQLDAVGKPDGKPLN